MGFSTFFVYTHLYKISKDIGINKEKDICLPNKEYIYMVIDVKEQIWLPDVECPAL